MKRNLLKIVGLIIIVAIGCILTFSLRLTFRNWESWVITILTCSYGTINFVDGLTRERRA